MRIEEPRSHCCNADLGFFDDLSQRFGAPGDFAQAYVIAQKMATGHVAPDRFTHGTSAQRVESFRRGTDSGDPAACKTFGRTTD